MSKKKKRKKYKKISKKITKQTAKNESVNMKKKVTILPNLHFTTERKKMKTSVISK